jgi:hypothetical protein
MSVTFIHIMTQLKKHNKKIEADIAKSGQRRLSWC